MGIGKKRPWTPKEGRTRWRLYLWIMWGSNLFVVYGDEEPLGAASFWRLTSFSWASSAEILCSISLFASFSDSSSRIISDADDIEIRLKGTNERTNKCWVLSSVQLQKHEERTSVDFSFIFSLRQTANTKQNQGFLFECYCAVVASLTRFGIFI